jgi:hypothetical protein
VLIRLTWQDAAGERQDSQLWLAQPCPGPFGHGVAICEIPIFALGYVTRLPPRLRESLQTEIRSRFTIGHAGLASTKRGGSWACQLESGD